MTRSQVINKLDKTFSRFIRLRDSEDGYATCFTCGVKKEWKKVDAGHFQTRSKYSIRWDEKNVHAQCKHCNMTNGGQQYTYGIKLDEVYGEGTAEELVRKGNQLTIKHTTQELIELEKHYKRLANELERIS